MRAKETLQLRHQLSASGLSLRAAAYDTKRHHVLSYDSNFLRPHVLRLFSLRRELKSVSLLEQEEEENGSKQAVPSSMSPSGGLPVRHRPSFLDLHQQKRTIEAKGEVIVPTVLLQYSPFLDIFICVYSKATRARNSTKVPKDTTHYVLLLEPATLRKLLVYQGPETHLLQCAHYDPVTDRLVLASHLKSIGNGADREGMMFPSAPKNVVEIVQLSKRPEDSKGLCRGEEPRMLLLIENTRASLRHPDTLTIICGSKGLKALYGAANDCDSTDSSMLEWRHNQLKFVLVRRVMLRHGISAMAVSPCGDWLLAGSSQGGLRVWNVNGSGTNASGLFTIDTEPFDPSGSSVTDAQSQVISSIEATTTPMPSSTDEAVALADVIVIAVERDTGVVRHWRFSVERKTFESDNDVSSLGEHRYPRLSLVGYFDTGGKDPLGKGESPGKFKHQDTLGPPLKVLTMCVTIDMGSCFENLLLVVREDVIHVLKVQTVLYVMQEFSSIEQAYAVRALGHQDFCQVISLSSTAACKLRLFPLDENSHQSSSKLLFVTPQTAENSHVCAMETIMCTSSMQLSFVVLAWSNGVVDIYEILTEKHVMRLEDKHLADQISTLSVVQYHHVIKRKGPSLPDNADKGGLWSSRSDENITTFVTPIDEPNDAIERRVIIFVGTESGKLFGWKTDALSGENVAFQSISHANVRVQAAHSSHIIQLARFDAVDHGERPLLASVGAGGVIKFWRVPSLKVMSYINSIADGYPASPSSIELLKGMGTRNEKVKDFVAVGYEDGRVAVWKIDFKRVLFQKLDVSTKHERCVSKICRVSSKVVSSGLVELLSCSLDMTVIQWEILESGTVHEKRYFDIGSAIVDMILVKEQAVVALAHEVCKFVFAPSSKCDVKYLVKPEAEANSETEKLQKVSDNDDMLPTDSDYPDTPTTRSVDNATEAEPPTQRTVDEYLTLHVPSAVLHLEASSLTAGTGTDSRDQHEDAFKLESEATDKMSRHTKVEKSTGQLPHAFVNDDILRDYLKEYIGCHGTGGTMAASRITHLLALRPELPSIKRLGFALAKILKDLKLTAQGRVDTEDALQILKLLYATSKDSPSSFDAPTMARRLKLKESQSEQARAQRLREKKQALRIPVVTYNLLGEKHVRWKEGFPEREKVKRNQGPSSPINSLTIHTPSSPNMRDGSAFEDNSTPERSGFAESDTPHALNSTVNDVDTDSPRVSSTEDAEEEVEESGEENEEEDEESVEESEEEDEDENEGEEDDGNENDDDNEGLSKDNENSVVVNESPAVPATVPAKKMRGVKRFRHYTGPNGNISSDALVNSIRLSPMFQSLWTKDYCWCSPAPPLNIVWTDDDKAKRTKVRPKCDVCHKRQHAVGLPRVGYTPHFSRQATFDIIVEVYSKLTATAHSSLYKNTRPQKEECSIFGVLFEVFLTTYGVRSTVELKLKLFFVSMCHLLPEYDAVAVFGELLGLHKSNVADEYDHAPATLVALCVCCYSWLYSRGMVVNGDHFSGRIRGSEWNIYRSATEVVPATDGTSRWQFVRIEHALLCAQDNLLYPLVSPGFLRNIMLFMQDYGQRAPTRSVRTDSPDFGTENDGAHWIEVHRFLRLLVGEWKHQNAEFRLVERLLFVYPQRDTPIEDELLEKLRLLLSCFIFYDHERVGVMAIGDFETLLYKLRYLWPMEGADSDVLLSDKAFEEAIVAIKKRFLDLNHDGLLCYLDFWAMLYIVGVKTRSLIRFLELPSFCRDYRLEMSTELSGMVWNYMQLSCTLLLPKGLQVGKSSMDQKAERQHRRRVGGLHDGTFHFSKTLHGSLSAQELLGTDDTQRHGLYLDGSVPASRQTASTTALDRFRPISVVGELHSGSSACQGREPVVVGVRPTGPTPKRAAPLSVSLMGNFETSSVIKAGNYAGVSSKSVRRMNRRPKEQSQGYTNMYIQFPQVAPVRKHVNSNERTQVLRGDPMKDTREGESNTIYENEVIEQEPERVEDIPALKTASTRPLSSKTTVSIPEPIPIIHQELIVEILRPRSATNVVVVPTAETDTPISSADSQDMKRETPRTLLRAVSDRIQLEEVAAQIEAEQEEEQVPSPRQPTPVPTPTPTSREDLPEIDDQSVLPTENDSEVEAEDVEQPVEVVEDVQEGSVATVDAPPEPEPVEVSPEPVEPITAPIIEEVIVENVVEPTVVDEELSEEVAVTDGIEVDEPLEERVIPTPPSPVEEPAPVEIPITEEETSDVLSEEIPPDPDVSSYQPQVLKQDDIQIHHTFRFSQQPTFLRGVVVTNNPYRTAMWNPDDDSESDDSETGKSALTGSKAVDVASVYRDDVNPSSSLKRKKDSEATATSHLGSSPLTLTKQSSSRDLTRLNKLKLQSRRSKLEYHFSDDLKAIQDEGDDNQGLISDTPLLPFRRKRLDEEAERALYGERVMNVLGEGIAFSAEAEAAMQYKWQQFFDDSEEKMFSAMRNDLEKKQTEQREAEERQNRLRKKWQEQRDQDLLRLQHSRQNSTLVPSKQSGGENETVAVDATFRLRRIHRESCRQLTEELQFGVSVQRELEDTKTPQFFHFYYLPEGHGSIITLKMHKLKGDAEVFMSTDTKVPCSTDFMWRSSERLAKDTREGHRIVLYPHDLLKVATKADKTSLRIGFYLSVVALEPGTSFTLAVMSSGQKMQPSRAIQTVDYLIDRFNMLSRSFEAQSHVPFDSQASSSRRRAVVRRQSFAGDEDDMDADEEGHNSDDTATESTEMLARRKTKKVDVVDPQELKSFQYLLETLSERKGFGSPRAASILLSGPSEDHLEFIQDEDQRLQEMYQRLSPPKTLGAPPDPMTVVTERRLTMQGKRQKLRRVVAARLQQKLTPLPHKSVGEELVKSASTGAWGNIHPVAYSISTLDPLPRSQRFKMTISPLVRAKSSAIVES